MAARKPTIVIVPGAWQQVEAFDTIIEELKSAGFPSEVVAHPSVGGTTDPLPDLDDDVAVVRTAVSKHIDAGTEVILLCHSYGGLVGGNATEGLDLLTCSRAGKKGGIKQIIFLAAFMVPAGKTLFELLGGRPTPWMEVKSDRISVKPTHIKELGFNDLPPEMAVAACKQMTYSSAAVFNAPSTFEPWACAYEIPCAYIFTTMDNALPLPIQQQLAKQLSPDAKTITLRAGHCPFISTPEKVVEAIIKLSTT
ncbi:hypothetical protein K3495_g8241 [Podosphaera aphanis]|nr:hypothetical protein K3495_g8241 [Podosphaera aphanis]